MQLPIPAHSYMKDWNHCVFDGVSELGVAGVWVLSDHFVTGAADKGSPLAPPLPRVQVHLKGIDRISAVIIPKNSLQARIACDHRCMHYRHNHDVTASCMRLEEAKVKNRLLEKP